MAKLLSIDNFSNMGDNGIFYLQGLSTRKISGKTVLRPVYTTLTVFNEDTNGYSGIEEVEGMASWSHQSENRVVMTGGANMKIYESSSSGAGKGLIHDSPFTGQFLVSFCGLQDVFVTKNGNLLYSLGASLGYGVRGQTNGTSTTKIVDDQGRDFTALGLGTSSDNNKVYNLSKGEEHTITSISTTTSPNDTLNFTAGTYTNTDGDWFVAFADRGAYNSGNRWNSFLTTAFPQFQDQEENLSWIRQIVPFDTEILIGNGNFLAALNEDEVTWNDNYKQLPSNVQFSCMDTNQSRILIGGSIGSRGKLCLWDGYSDGFLSIIEFPDNISSIKAFGSGWVFASINGIYSTDGYNYTKIADIPDQESYRGSMNLIANGMVTHDETIFLLLAPNGFTRAKSGLWIYEVGYGWTYTPTTNSLGSNLYDLNVKALELVGNDGEDIMGYVACGGATAGINVFRVFSSGGTTSEVIFRQDLVEKRNIKEVHVKISFNNTTDASVTNDQILMSCAISNDDRALWKSAQTGSGCTTTSIVNATGGNQYNRGTVGDLVMPLNGDAGGEQSFIQSIANAGTSSETWTISPAFSKAPVDTTDFNIISMKKQDETKTISLTTLPEFIKFQVTGIYTDLMYLRLHVTGGRNFTIDRVDVYGD